MRTLMGGAGSDRPQRRTALVGMELGRLGIQITELGERLGRSKKMVMDTLSSDADVKVKRSVKQELDLPLKRYLLLSFQDRLMTLRLPLSGNKHAIIVSVCAPTMTNPDEIKNMFYDDLDEVISSLSFLAI